MAEDRVAPAAPGRAEEIASSMSSSARQPSSAERRIREGTDCVTGVRRDGASVTDKAEPKTRPEDPTSSRTVTPFPVPTSMTTLATRPRGPRASACACGEHRGARQRTSAGTTDRASWMSDIHSAVERSAEVRARSSMSCAGGVVKPLLFGVAVGVLVFVLLLLAFARSTEVWELLLWAVIGCAVGAVTTVLQRRSAART